MGKQVSRLPKRSNKDERTAEATMLYRAEKGHLYNTCVHSGGRLDVEKTAWHALVALDLA